MTTEIATLLLPLHQRAPMSNEEMLYRFSGVDESGREQVEIALTTHGLYIFPADSTPVLAVSLKTLCNAALKAAGRVQEAAQ